MRKIKEEKVPCTFNVRLAQVPRKAAHRVCEICRRDDTKINRFINHHLLYDPPVLVTLCWGCHARLHNSARSFNHPFEKVYGKDLGPYRFALAVVALYEDRVVEPEMLLMMMENKNVKGGKNGKKEEKNV
jgi:hypothetical protein